MAGFLFGSGMMIPEFMFMILWLGVAIFKIKDARKFQGEEKWRPYFLVCGFFHVVLLVVLRAELAKVGELAPFFYILEPTVSVIIFFECNKIVEGA
ncbi:MAG: hypothetical protein M3Y39_14850 [Chloroflexota bacterium]|nr:hypothetical protein [Chloroflexota bacterium]